MDIASMTPESISAIMVKLEIADRQVLFIILADDGLVNRVGTGVADNDEDDLYIGKTTDPLFTQLRAKVAPEWVNLFGAYEVPDKAGETCKLSILVKAAGNEEGGITFIYGLESKGPPQ